ncbi:hypothetical protein PSTG_12232 [Puccinia striiformis f. sp. tritici PST-78]|uniref:Uncharacterized protein n=1 Tax=Puccinia striiformis f. sp. tritici PST-78 TaxID=1165861 RepID=A0A0L0V588_9BASI|nr:hypothetical protein PSTG_12232 [Puccinia striiformis f. sp. tritici PST-78]
MTHLLSSWLVLCRIHWFENVNVLIFFVAINEFDQVLYEDECVKRPHYLTQSATLSGFARRK